MSLAWLSGGKAVMQGGKPILCNQCPCKICGNECWFDGAAQTNGDGTFVNPYNSISAIMTYMHNSMYVDCRCMIVHCITNVGIHSAEITSIANGFDYTDNSYRAYMVFVHDGDSMFDLYIDHSDNDTTTTNGAYNWTYGAEKFDINLSLTYENYCNTRLFRLIDCTYNIPMFDPNISGRPIVSFGAIVDGHSNRYLCITAASDCINLALREDLSNRDYSFRLLFVNTSNCDIPDTAYSVIIGTDLQILGSGITGSISNISMTGSSIVTRRTVEMYAAIISDVIISSTVLFYRISILCIQLNNCNFAVQTVSDTNISQYAYGTSYNPASSSNHTKLYINNCIFTNRLYIYYGKYWDVHLVSSSMGALINRYATYTSVYVYPTMTHGAITHTGTGNEVIYV